MIHKGYIQKVCIDRGFGFLRRCGDRTDIYFHISGLSDDLEFNEQLVERFVRFQLRETTDGRTLAYDIKPQDWEQK